LIVDTIRGLAKVIQKQGHWCADRHLAKCAISFTAQTLPGILFVNLLQKTATLKKLTA
jgi:hypothetical protein